MRFGLKGSPDIIGILSSGRFLGVECKSPKGRQTPDQVDFQRRCEAQYGLYVLTKSVADLEKALTT